MLLERRQRINTENQDMTTQQNGTGSNLQSQAPQNLNADEDADTGQDEHIAQGDIY